jgi:hypothetical protein
MFEKAAREQRELETLRVEVDRLRVFVETRAQAQENLVRAMLRDTGARAGEALEARIDLAVREAIAFADQGLSQQQAALRLLGRRVAELSKELSAPNVTPWVGDPAPPVGAYLLGAPAPEWGNCRRLEIREDNEDVFVADLADLGVPPGGAEKLVASHVLEYAPIRALEEAILPHWRERLAPGGEVVIVTVDGPAWTAELARDAADFERMRVRLGASAARGLRSLFDFESLARLLSATGLAVAERPNGTDRLELRAIARSAT